MEDIDYRAARGLDKAVVRSLIQDSDWVRRHQHIFLVGPTGIGKTFLARAFGQKACRDGFTAYFATAAQLFRELELARADGSYAKKLRTLGQVDVLIVDDWAMSPLTDAERRAFLEICDERYQTRATLLTSQLPVAKWHGQIGDPTVADSILDRLVHAAHRLEMQGESMRKKKGGRNEKDGE
jgi:DNA replication protein DnaC